MYDPARLFAAAIRDRGGARRNRRRDDGGALAAEAGRGAVRPARVVGDRGGARGLAVGGVRRPALADPAPCAGRSRAHRPLLRRRQTQCDDGEVVAARPRGGQAVRHQADARSRPRSSAAQVRAASLCLGRVSPAGAFFSTRSSSSAAIRACSAAGATPSWRAGSAGTTRTALPGIATVAAFTDDFVSRDVRRPPRRRADSRDAATESADAPGRVGATVHGGIATDARRPPRRARRGRLVGCAGADRRASITTPTFGVLRRSRSASGGRESRCASTSRPGSPNGTSSASTANERRSRPARFRPTIPRAPSWSRRPLRARATRSNPSRA